MLTSSASTAPALAAAPLALAAAVLCWPQRRSRLRVAALLEPQRPRVGRLTRLVRPGPAVVIALAGCAGVVLAGAGGALAGVLAAVTVSKRWRARREQTRSITAAADVVQALGLLVGELRAGAHPAAAAEHTAADAGPAAGAVLRTIARTARLSGDVAAALRRQADADIGLEQPLRQLAAAWTLGSRHGIPLADVLEAVRRDLDHQVRARRRLHSALAGPRATAMVLATLPILGLLLGQAVGAQPWHVLTRHPAGQVLLVLGSALVCAGLSWSARLAGRAGAS